jgi:3',5'-cyclic AMP phosphodiesterase CpdA
MIRLAHATDIHWMCPPTIGRLAGKRFLGTANLYLRRRRQEFSREAQSALVRAMTEAAPDVVAITGDLTAQALPEEFDDAHEALAPLLDAHHGFVIPGNHDVYTTAAYRERRIRERFGAWMGLEDGRSIGRLDVGELTLLGLDPNRPTGLLAAGQLPQVQLDELAAVLADPSMADRTVVLCVHYPVLGPGGQPYDNRGHGLLNARALIDVLGAAPKLPAAILHGHKHHGYRVELDLPGGSVPSLNPGSGGLVPDAKHGRTGAFNVYTLEAGRVTAIERHLFDGARFSPEPGGAYASGQ